MLSTIFSRRLRRSAAVLVAAGAMLTGGVAASAQAIEPPPAPDTATEAPAPENNDPQTDESPGVEPQIIGGGEASEAYSFMATLGFIAQDGENTSDLGHQCGASLVFHEWVLTAAHCVADPPAGLTQAEQDELSARFGMNLYDHVPSEGSFYTRIGSKDRITGGVTADVTQIVVHPKFKWFENSPPDPVSDLAMLKLDTYVQLQPIQLAGTAAVPDSAIRLLGWGITEPDTTGPDPIVLQELDTTVAHDAACRFGIPGDITDGEICTDNPHGTDGPCFGDSGGPAIQKGTDSRWKLVGTTSRGSRWCGTTTAIYSSPPDFRTWIYNTARGNPGSGTATPTKGSVTMPATPPARGSAKVPALASKYGRAFSAITCRC